MRACVTNSCRFRKRSSSCSDMAWLFRAGLTTLAPYRYDAALANQADDPPKRRREHAPHSDAQHPFRGNLADCLRFAAARLGAEDRPAWQAGVLGPAEGHRILHRRRTVPAWPRILSAGAEIAH